MDDEEEVKEGGVSSVFTPGEEDGEGVKVGGVRFAFVSKEGEEERGVGEGD